MAVGEVEVCEAKLHKSLSLVFIRFLRGPVGTRGFMGGEERGGEFNRCSEYGLFFRLTHTMICYAWGAPLGLSSHPTE